MKTTQTDQAKQAERSGKGGQLGRRLMAAMLTVIAVVVVGVLFAYGLRKPENGPGNVPAQGDARPLRDNGSPPTSK
ncbi:hypothetical protein [Variovorax sp. RCC_210]|uniref:hypothetical protein n=1 Tax=Variovorax sp. RCC_210 TaxID=3239217 RepID=UPI003525DA0D